MHLSIYITVFGNWFKNFNLLKADFVGFNINLTGIGYFVLNLIFSLFLILTYYLIGDKLRKVFLKEDCQRLGLFINVALGYIIVNSGLGILGISSLLYPVIIFICLGVVTMNAFFSFKLALRSSLKFFSSLKLIFNLKKSVVVGTCLFVLIAFFRLIPPEIGEDAMGYHTGDPRLFLKNNTSIIKTITPPYVIPAPHLGEMSYVFSEVIGLRDSARYIHFMFYFLLVGLILSVNSYAALLFVTAPVIIQVSSKANVDFQWLLCWLLSIFLITRSSINRKVVFLAGLLFGGVLASKMWTITFLPLFVLYLVLSKDSLSHRIKCIAIFLIAIFSVDSLWLLRSYLISGNPIYPMFSNATALGGTGGSLGLENVLGFNKLMFHIRNISVFSPLFYLAGLSLLFDHKKGYTLLRKLPFVTFFLFVAVTYLLVKYHFGRYLLGLYSLFIFIVSVNLERIIKRSDVFKMVFIIGFSILFSYYFLNTLFQLPYAFGWADKNKYLTRIIFRDNANYYNFDNKFNHLISSKDKVATYRVWGFYYADFNYLDINSILKKRDDFNLLSKNGMSKLLIRGGDVDWFCKALSLRNCETSKTSLISRYPKNKGMFFLYSLR